MRKSREEAAQTRKRIVTAAAGEFRKNGIVATGLNDLMKAAGLTHGGFYKHFESKDQLVAEACAEAVEAMIANVAGRRRRSGAAAAAYLSTGHRDNPADGCPLAAIGSELGRSDEKTRAVATDGFLKLVEIMAGQFGDMPPDVARRRALVAVSTMIGAVTMSRIVTDPESVGGDPRRGAEEFDGTWKATAKLVLTAHRRHDRPGHRRGPLRDGRRVNRCAGSDRRGTVPRLVNRVPSDYKGRGRLACSRDVKQGLTNSGCRAVGRSGLRTSVMRCGITLALGGSMGILALSAWALGPIGAVRRRTSTRGSRRSWPGGAWGATPAPTPKGKLDLSRRDAAFAGGESGPAIVAGRPAESLLWEYVDGDEMPPKPPLSAAEKAVLKAWIAAGAAWGTDPIDVLRMTTDRRAGRDWWSLQPVARPAPPEVKDPGWCAGPIDRFVLQGLETAGLRPSKPAGRRTLIRRLSFDLTGLPPTPEEVDAFVADDRPDAYERLVERYLASPQYGVRWARLVARPRPLRREQRVRARRVPARRLALPRLGRQRPERRPALRRVRPPAARRGRAPARRPLGRRGDRLPRRRGV